MLVRTLLLPVVALLLFGTRSFALEVGDVVIVVVPGEVKLGEKVVGKVGLGDSYALNAIRGKWVNIVGGWVPRSSVKSAADAEPFFADLVQREPENSFAWFGLGNSRRILGQYGPAFEAIQKAVEADPAHVGYYSIGGVVLTLQEDWPGVLDWASEGLKKFSGDPEHTWLEMQLRSFRARAYHKTGENEKALEEITQALNLPKDDKAERHIVLILRASVLRGIGDLPAALNSLDEALELNNDFPATHVDRGHIRVLMSDWEGAVADYKNCYELQPSRVFAVPTAESSRYYFSGDGPLSAAITSSFEPWRSPHYGLVMLWAACPNEEVRDGKAAVELAAKLRTLDRGRYFQFIAAEAAAYAEVGDFKKSIELQKQALALAPDAAKEPLQKGLDQYERSKPLRLDMKPSETIGDRVADEQ